MRSCRCSRIARTRWLSAIPPQTTPRWARWSASPRSARSPRGSAARSHRVRSPLPVGTATGRPLAAGYFIAPTIMELGTGAVDLWTEELFGPVLAVRRAADTEEAFRLANDSEYGLSAAIFTKDLTRALSAVDHVDVGILHVNSESAGADPHVPFGGAKKSGLGPKEQGRAAREFFTHTTTVYLRGEEAM